MINRKIQIKTKYFIQKLKESRMSPRNNQLYQKNHSFSKPVSLAQATSWVVFLSQALVFYIYVINQFQNINFQITLVILYTLSFVALIIAAIWTSQADPTDELTIANKCKDLQKIIAIKQTPKKLFYCPLCESTVKQKSRHCKTCQRCCQNFDHHCIWLNICIGQKNYKPFAVTISMTFINFFFYLLAISFLSQQMRVNQSDTKSAGFVLMWIVGIVVAVFQFLISNLILLHIYLKLRGISTFQFVLLRAQQKIKEENEELEKKKQTQEKKKAQKIQQQQNSQSFLKQQSKRKHNAKSIDDTIVEDKTSREKQQISDKNSYSESENNTQKVYCLSNLQNYLNFANKDQTERPSEVRLSQFKNDLNPQNHSTYRNKFSSDKKSEPQSNQNGGRQSMDLNQTQKKYLTRKPKQKKKINNFFAKNASLDLFFQKNNQTIEPQEDLCKAIELDQKIKQFKKRKQNNSLVIESKLQESNQQNPKQWKFFSANKKKRSVHESYTKQGNRVEQSFGKKNLLEINQMSEIKMSTQNGKGSTQNLSIKTDKTIRSLFKKQETNQNE